MSPAELAALCDEAEARGLSIMLFASPRAKDGRRLPEPRRVLRKLDVRPVGADPTHWHVSVRVDEARAFCAQLGPDVVIPLGAPMPPRSTP